ncbi:MAG: DUF411 domain-containing protein [Rhizobiales bacterium]|nr:DUF411 domain-containing protein [Hyphomicrobiales bacterium]
MLKGLSLSRRSVFALVAGAGILIIGNGRASQHRIITVHKDPNCSCCTGWAQHLANADFEVKTVDTANLDAVKQRLGVPPDLAACHTADVDGYAIEGHVPASALKRFLDEKPNASGLAVPGMPFGSPGMEGGVPETYTVIQFGAQGQREYMRFVGDRPL